MKGERVWVVFLLGLGLVRGLIYLSVVPPWQHYDEPVHFERSFWIAAPSPDISGSASLSLPAEIAASMCDFHFWEDGACGLLPLSYERPPTLEALGASSQPVYYLLNAPAQFLFRHAPVEIRLYVGRLVSVVLFVLTLAIAYFLLRDLFPTSLEIRLVVPILVALIPAFTDEMSALNNDVGAVAMFSFLLWGVVRLMRHGWSPVSLAWVMGAAFLALLTKRTAAMGLIVALVAVFLSCRKVRWWIGAVGSGILAFAVVLFAFSWSGSASWYELQSPASGTVRVLSDGPLGRHVTCAREGRVLIQELATDRVTALEGQEVTLGAWVRVYSSEEVVPVFSVYDGAVFHTQVVTVTAGWQFHAMTMTVSPQVSALQVRLLSPGEEGMACYDGVVLARGEFPLNEQPQFDDINGDSGVWGGQAFMNILSNGSGEHGWPRLRPWVSSLLLRSGLLYSVDPTLFVQSILDCRRTGWIYLAQVDMLFRSFWARFGWNHIGLPDGYYRVVLVPTVLGVIGAVLSFRHLMPGGHLRSWQRRSLALLAFSALLVWGGAVIGYSHPQLAAFPISIVAARYAYPAIIPTVLFLFLGWRELVPRRWRRFLPVLSVLGVAWLDLVSLAGTILPFYYFR
jgi:hypothetical protein